MRQGLTIQVNVKTLQATLATNRDKHLADYQKAKRGWRKVLRKQLETLLADLDADKSLDAQRLRLEPKPTHYLPEYDEALEMLGWATDATLELDSTQFRAYIKDEWSWKTSWETSNSTYIEAAG